MFISGPKNAPRTKSYWVFKETNVVRKFTERGYMFAQSTTHCARELKTAKRAFISRPKSYRLFKENGDLEGVIHSSPHSTTDSSTSLNITKWVYFEA